MLLFIYSFASFTFYGYITNSQSDQLPDGLIARLLSTAPVLQSWWVWIPFRAEFFQALISQLLSCVCNCDDQSKIHIFLGSSNIWSFLYSFALLLLLLLLLLTFIVLSVFINFDSTFKPYYHHHYHYCIIIVIITITIIIIITRTCKTGI